MVRVLDSFRRDELISSRRRIEFRIEKRNRRTDGWMDDILQWHPSPFEAVSLIIINGSAESTICAFAIRQRHIHNPRAYASRKVIVDISVRIPSLRA